MKRKQFFLFIFLSSIFFTVHSITPSPNDYKQELISRIKSKKLYLDPLWLKLGYYQKKWNGKWKGEVDKAEFYLAKNGRYNPESEMISTVESFFEEKNPDPQILHPQCFFPARYSWLKSKLNFDTNKFTEQPCQIFESWKNSLNPSSISLVFSSYYLQNPSSMFGHNMYKINSKGNVGNELLDYSINYAANQTDTNPFIYSFKGLFGGYDGVFSLFPYYLKVNEYSDLETRDIWEYKLNFTEEQLDFFIRHLWEMARVTFDYYFFTQNCAYRLLPLLEVIDQNLTLTEKSRYVANPADSVKLYFKNKNLVQSRNYRPSLFSQIQNRIYSMKEEERKIFYDLISKLDTYQKINTKKMRKSLILDALLDVYRYKKLKGELEPNKDSSYKKYLLDRSNITEEYSIDEKKEWSSPPEIMHEMSRVAMNIGHSSLGSFHEFKYRFSYTDLLNTDDGKLANSEIQFMNIHLRKYQNQNKLMIDRFQLLSIISLPPYNSISNNVSYKLDFGYEPSMIKRDYQNLFRDSYSLSQIDFSNPINQWGIHQYNYFVQKEIEQKRIHPLYGDISFGYTYRNVYNDFWKNFSTSALIGLKMQSHPSFINGYRYAPSMSLIFLYTFKNFKYLFSYSYNHYSINNQKDDYNLSFKVRYSLKTNHELRLEYNQYKFYNESLLSYHYMF